MKRRVFLSVLATVPFLNWLAPAAQKPQPISALDGLDNDALFSSPQFENAIRIRHEMSGVRLGFSPNSPNIPIIDDLAAINGQLMRAYKWELQLDPPMVWVTFARYQPSIFADGYDTLTAHL